MNAIAHLRIHTRAEVQAMSESEKVELILALEARLCVLEQRLRDLGYRLALNSRNSSKPPSSDGPAKPMGGMPGGPEGMGGDY